MLEKFTANLNQFFDYIQYKPKKELKELQDIINNTINNNRYMFGNKRKINIFIFSNNKISLSYDLDIFVFEKNSEIKYNTKVAEDLEYIIEYIVF